MLEELRRRNFATTTVESNIHGVEHFSRHFHRPPDQLGPEHIRQYQAMLFTELKLSPNTVIVRLRFFYIHVLKRNWSIAETPNPKNVLHLPRVLSQEEVARLIAAAEFPFHRILPMTLYATGARRAEVASLNAVASGLTANARRCRSPSHAAVTQRWVDIAISAQIADILPSRTTRVVTGIVPVARATPAIAGCRRENGSCCPPATCTLSSRCRGN